MRGRGDKEEEKLPVERERATKAYSVAEGQQKAYNVAEAQ